jgi:spore coat protein CotH
MRKDPTKLIHKILIFSLLSILMFISCTKDIEIMDEGELFNHFTFEKANNPALREDVFFKEEGLVLKTTMFSGFYDKDLVASFDLKSGYHAYVGGKLQESGKSVVDFSQPVHYLVEGNGEQYYFLVVVDFQINLPTLYIETENGREVDSKDDYLHAELYLNALGQFPDIRAAIKIRGRGNSTWDKHPKKPYQIKFDVKTSVLGMPADKRWVLLAEYSDKSFLRNMTAFELGYLSNLEWTPHAKYVNVSLNNRPIGLYLLVQKVEESENKVDIGKDGYLLEIDQLDRLDEGDVYFNTEHYLLNIKEPELLSYGAESEYIQSYLQAFETSLFGEDILDPEQGYQKYVNIVSVVDWFWINELAKNIDALGGASIYMYKEKGEKLNMGPIWDFDIGFGNTNFADTQYPERWWVKANKWIHKMLKDPEFVALLKSRYSYFRSKESYLFHKMDEHATQIQEAERVNDDIWHSTGVFVWPNPIVFESYEEEVEHLKNWIHTRFEWLDLAVEEL